jgi:drug/metabolite transporter (DMT)-like permease
VSPAAFAFASSICFAGAFVASKRGLAGTSLVATILITFGAAWSVTVLAAAITFSDVPSRGAIALFLLTGVVAPGIGYSAALVGVEKLGPSISVPIQQGTRPVFSVCAAAVLLGESVGWMRVLGILAIVAGTVGLGTKRRGDQFSATLEPREGRSTGIVGRVRPGLIWPFIAAVAFATFDLFVKTGLNIMKNPNLAAAITLGSGFLLWAVLAASIPALRTAVVLGPSVGWVAAGGVLFGFAALCVFHALQSGSISLVSPILATQPLLVFVFSWVALQGLESINLTTVLQGSLVVAGTVLVVV